ncbi:COG1470 family protein [Blautia sp. HCP3S3_G3]|uniref:COG1470 family protein n=1 Tax=Blautia sp. HCP3S3_G3 TaxID=3438913 RepID=UPI003F8CCCEF
MEILQTSRKKLLIVLSMLCALCMCLMGTPRIVRADSGLTLSTDYPGISVKPGDTSSFTLYLLNGTDTEMNAALSAEKLPEGWEGYFRGSSSEVSSVHVFGNQTKEDSPSLNYSLTIPGETEEGDYQVVLKADAGDDGVAELPLTIHVTTEEAGQGNFTAEYPELQGDTGTSFSFDTTLVNNGSVSQSYSLSANAPEGWQVTFTPSGESSQAASIPVDAGASQGITVKVTPSEKAEQGDYTISCTAVSANETLNLDLKVTIIGTYSLGLSTSTGNLSVSAYANEEAKVTLSIQNTGNVDLNNLQLSSSASTDWNVRFDETTIDTLEAGTTKEITAYIQPSEDAIIGDYVTSITISNDQTSAQTDLRVSVKNHTTWGVAAIAIIVILVAGLAAIIRKYGRR